MLYKIGFENYKNADDKNCGLYEFNLIKEQIEKIKFDSKHLIIVNGMLSEDECSSLKDIMKYYDKKNRIYILTDLSLVNNNLDIAKECGILLHSSKNIYFGKDMFDENYYSYIPDLYYDENRTRNYIKSDIILFGGSFGSTILNDYSVQKYIFNDDGIVNDKILFMFKGRANDYRVNYNDYKKILDLCKYILCIKREEFIDDAWVTPRLLDGISSYCLPLVDKDYDVEYNYPKEYLCKDYNDVRKLMDYFENNKLEKEEIIQNLRNEAKERKNNFLKLIESL